MLLLDIVHIVYCTPDFDLPAHFNEQAFFEDVANEAAACVGAVEGEELTDGSTDDC